MPGPLSCVSDLLDPGAAGADTLKCQWLRHNLEGRKSPASEQKPNTVKGFPKFRAADLSDITETPELESESSQSEHTMRPRLRSPHLSLASQSDS